MLPKVTLMLFDATFCRSTVHAVLSGMIAEGKDKLEWYRQVDPAKLNTLKELIASPNYKVSTVIQFTKKLINN
jgi:hypothetical protein